MSVVVLFYNLYVLVHRLNYFFVIILRIVFMIITSIISTLHVQVW